MHVELIAWTPNPERTVAAAARLCYSPASAAEIARAMSPEKTRSFVKKLVEMGHQSPLEHVSFTFAIDGVSRALSHQLVRHRIASYSQKSQRYVDEKGFTWIMPPSIEKSPKAKEIFEKQIESIRRCYAELCAAVPREDARYILPNACETKLVVTMNARSLLHFFRVRCCRRAQWEIRRLARMMLAEVRKVAPDLFKDAGPPCETDQYCPEGEMSCGRLQGKVKDEDKAEA
ncbi:MAG: FAD-dependent thymidylate synthase [Dethiobacteria bacterium]|nr:FAD-dependent thymidylate synthase [Bacillota bacterium]HOJ83333.1 FAD-dependent thymidylate synthase [Bacillota bacterium]HOL16106.1 FAD-dependent thymidylate synthase [Bacillota bacterium]